MRKDDDLSKLRVHIPEEVSHTGQVEKFLNVYQNLRYKFQGFGTTWDTFAQRSRALARIEDGFSPTAGKNEQLNTFEKVTLNCVYGIMLAESIQCDICPRLQREDREDLIPRFKLHDVPWLSGSYKDDHGEVPILEILTEFGREYQKKEMEFETFDFLATLLTGQIRQELAKNGFSPTRLALTGLIQLSDLNDVILHEVYNIPNHRRSKLIISLFKSMTDYVVDTLEDPADEHHEYMRNFIDEANKLYESPQGFTQLFRTRFIDHAGHSEGHQHGALSRIIALRRYGRAVGDPWYEDITNSFIEGVRRIKDRRLLTTQDLTAHLDISNASEIDYRSLQEEVEKWEDNSNLLVLYLIDKPDLVHSFFPRASNCSIIINRQENVLGVHVYIMPEIEEDKTDGTDSSLKNLNFLYAIDISPHQPEIFLQLIDEENITDNLRSTIIKLTTAALANRLIEEDTILPQNLDPSSIVRPQIGQAKAKGPERTPGSGKKRKHNGIKQNTMDVQTAEFLADIQAARYRYELSFSTETSAYLQDAYRYSSEQMNLFHKKVATYNAGGAIAKTLIDTVGPNGGKVFEIKTARFRILAEVNEKERRSTVYNIVPRTDLKESIANRK